MKYYFAPMEGVTGYIYRNAHHKYFGGIDRYYMPFLVPTHTQSLKSREINDVLPEHNQGICAVPQILTNDAEHFLWAAEKIRGLGYEEVNLNLGCPSPTVVPKRRGSGFLAYPDELDRFLDAVCRGMDRLTMKLSIKTRIGRDAPEEFEDLLEIFNRYPIAELIIHPRVQKDLYHNHPNMEVFSYACEHSRHPLCYNGDLVRAEEIRAFHDRYPSVPAVMLGRGLIADPALAEEAAGTGKPDKIRLKDFHDEVEAGYAALVSGDRNVLFKMKELWFYLGRSFAHFDRYEKKIKKSQHRAEYDALIAALFEELELL